MVEDVRQIHAQLARSALAAALGVAVVACAPPPVPTAKTSQASAQPDGFLYAARSDGEHVDVGLLATQVDGKLVAAAVEQQCAVIQKGRTIVPLNRGVPGANLSVASVFTNEANRCLGHIDDGVERHFVAHEGLSLRAGSPTISSPVSERDIARAAKALFLSKAAGSLGPTELAKMELSVHTFSADGLEWAAVTFVGGGNIDACAPEFPLYSGVAVYRVEADGKLALEMFRGDAQPDDDHYRGLVELVDFVPLARRQMPWVVLFRHACECWAFDLVGNAVIEDRAGGCTI